MTLKFLESICCKKEIAPQPEPRITTLGLLSRLCSMTLVVLKEEVPAAPDFSTEEVAVEVNLTRRETADTDVLFLQRADSIANRVFVAVLRCCLLYTSIDHRLVFVLLVYYHTRYYKVT